jgi:hypothetical protein
MWKVAAAGGEVRPLYMAVPLLAVAAMLAPAVAHADPVDDYISRNGKAVCAALDKAQTEGDIFGLALAIAHDGRNGDPSDAWDHAIKAMEDVLVPVVLPNQQNATLGSVLGHLRSQGNLWKMVLPGKDQSHDVAPLVGMLDVIWPNVDRHPGVPTTRSPTTEEARAVVTLAATIVQWHRDGWVLQRR